MGAGAVPGQNGPVGHGGAAVSGVHRHFFPVGGVPADGGVYRARVLPEAPRRHRLIGAGQAVVLELGGQSQVGAVVLGGETQAGGVLVDAVDDAGSQRSPHPGQAGAAVEEQGVDQGPVRVSRGGVDHHPHRLVHHNEVAVLIDHVQGDILGDQVHRLRVGEGEGQHAARGGAVLFSQRDSLQGDRAPLQQPLGGGAGQLGDQPGDEGVRPLPLPLSGQAQGGHAPPLRRGVPPAAPAKTDSTDPRRFPRSPRRCPPR